MSRRRAIRRVGELCDHTCDALVCTFAGMAIMSTVRVALGGPHTAMLLWFCGTWPFCLATWRMYHTGVMTLPEFNGPNEGLALLYLTHSFTALLGQHRCALHADAAPARDGRA